MQIRYYILKVKDVYEKVLKEVASDLQNIYLYIIGVAEIGNWNWISCTYENMKYEINIYL